MASMTEPASLPGQAAPLRFLFPGWFAMVMGLAGLSLAWHRSTPVMGSAAETAALAIGAVAAIVFAVLGLATMLRAARHRQAWTEDLRHPVRHTFVATLPISLVLLATVALASGVARPVTLSIWWVGALSQLLVTVWVLARWWRGNQAGGLQWASLTPALFIPVVGNVLVPLAGVPLGQPEWSAAQFGVGLLFWPAVTVLVLVRVAVQGAWPERLAPTAFIFMAPPAAIGLSSAQFGAPVLVQWALWGMTLFCLLWASTLLRRIAALPFGLPHWGMSFPMAAFTALTFRLLPTGPGAIVGVALLALTSLLIAALTLATIRGLRDGTLLAPEPVAAIAPVAAGG
jgi:tellurite resistance protein